ncbi:MAG: rhodanese-related sulfurtransferase [Cycloclasticus sp.]|jgi:phage shock protein E
MNNVIQQRNSTMIKPASEFIAEAQKNCLCVDVASAKSLFDNNSNAVVIDVREPAEAEQSKLTCSINIPRGLLEMKVPNHCTDPHMAILLHCAAGGRASLAAARLKEMGYTNAHAITAKFDDIKKAFD